MVEGKKKSFQGQSVRKLRNNVLVDVTELTSSNSSLFKQELQLNVSKAAYPPFLSVGEFEKKKRRCPVFV
jgi:hypothetical protein